jgi:hypothetical protein
LVVRRFICPEPLQVNGSNLPRVWGRCFDTRGRGGLRWRSQFALEPVNEGKLGALTDRRSEKLAPNERRPLTGSALVWRPQSRRMGPIAQIGCCVGQLGSPKQVIFFFTRWKLRGFLSDLSSERCDAILKRFCLFGRIQPHRASPHLGARAQYSQSPMDAEGGSGDQPLCRNATQVAGQY